jgi:hypothetical protein
LPIRSGTPVGDTRHSIPRGCLAGRPEKREYQIRIVTPVPAVIGNVTLIEHR